MLPSCFICGRYARYNNNERAACADHRDTHEDGLTLVEVLVATTLFTILSACILTVFLAATQLDNSITAMSTSTSELTTAGSRIQRVITTAKPRSSTTGVFISTTSPLPAKWNNNTLYEGCGTNQHPVQAYTAGNRIWMYADLNADYGLSLVHYYLNTNNELVEEVTHPDSTNTPDAPRYSTNRTCRTLAHNIVPPRTGETPLFTFYNPTSSKPLNSSNPERPITSTTSRATAAIEVSLTHRDTNTRNSTPVTTREFIPFNSLGTSTGPTGSWVYPPSNPAPPPGCTTGCTTTPQPPTPRPTTPGTGGNGNNNPQPPNPQPSLPGGLA